MDGGAKLTDEQLLECQRLIRTKVQRFVRGPARHHDAEDLSADVMVKVLKQLRRFNAERSGLNTFLNRVIDSELLDNYRHQRATKRDIRRNGRSLNENVLDGDGRSSQLADLIDGEQQQIRFGRRGRPQGDLDSLAIDLKDVLSKLSPSHRRLLEKLVHHSLPEVARGTQVSRGTIYRRLRAIRLELQDSGLRHYIPSSATTSSKVRK